jgi:tRNA threonylcarbamoyladenosine biosynthesis protein TsaE
MKYHLDKLSKAASWILEQDSRLIAFKGDLGAGKTTLIKEICSQLGVSQNMSSPSFSLVNEYYGEEGSIYHFDFYRLEKPEEALDFGVEEYFYSGAYCLMEWPEKVSGVLPSETLIVDISVLSEKERLLKLN